MEADTERPTTGGHPPDVDPRTLLDLVDAAVEADPAAPAIHYFGATLSRGEVARASDALAALLVGRGFRPGDRLALYLQDNPAFVVGLLAAWKAGGTAALISPMSKHDELAHAVRDYAPVALLALDDLYEDIARDVLAAGDHPVATVVTVSALDGRAHPDERVFAGVRKRHPADTLDLGALVAAGGTRPSVRAPTPADVAVLAPTSGTTGAPKAALLTHANLLFSAHTYRRWAGLVAGDPVLAMAPIVHVTGLVGAVLLSFVLPSPVVLTHRFHPTLVRDAVRAHRPAFAVAPITAFIALAESDGPVAADLASFRALGSGGAPISPEVADRLEAVLGHYIHNVYGQTESASPTHMVPWGVRAPVDPDTRTLSIGFPVPGARVRVVDEAGRRLPPGEIGEIVTAGPQIAPGYWRRPEETAAAFVDGALRTGDVGFVDREGWFYVVDRSTDLINAAGYKIWPHEVERVLVAHPAVREAAVVAIADSYRGQSTRAYVALAPGAEATESELIAFCRDRMAAYKYPREVEIVAALPRTATGKILRRALRG